MSDPKRINPHNRAMLRCSEEIEEAVVAITARFDLPADLAVGAAVGAVTRIIGKAATAAFLENRADGLVIGRAAVDLLREMARFTEELIDGLEGLPPAKERQARGGHLLVCARCGRPVPREAAEVGADGARVYHAFCYRAATREGEPR